MLEFSHVSFAFGAQEVLTDVSFTIPEGGALAVTGPSGCGKTTLLRLAAGLLEPGSGQIRRPAGGAAVVFQEPRLLPWLTAEENVNLVLSDRRETLPRAREWLAALGLGGDAGKYPRELSGGMQRRVATINSTLAQLGCNILWKMFRNGMIEHYGLYLNLSTLKMNPIPV